MPDPESIPDPILGERFADAAAYAVGLHARQARKSSTIPYATHLLAVCSLVLEDAGSEDEAIAALLHDGPEDQGGERILDEIRERFGEAVATLVEALSDAMPADGEEKEAWLPRKRRYLARLRGEDASVLRISLADKLHNARSMAADRERIGDAVWDRFNANRSEQARYYGALLDVFQARLPDSRNLPAFRQVVEALFPRDGGSPAHR